MVICHTAFQTTSYTARYVNICGGNASAIQHRVVHRPSRLLSGCKVSVHCSGGVCYFKDMVIAVLIEGERTRDLIELNRIVYCDAICIVSNKISMPKKEVILMP